MSRLVEVHFMIDFRDGQSVDAKFHCWPRADRLCRTCSRYASSVIVSAVPATTSAARRSISSSHALLAPGSGSPPKLRRSSSATLARSLSGRLRASSRTLDTVTLFTVALRNPNGSTPQAAAQTPMISRYTARIARPRNSNDLDESAQVERSAFFILGADCGRRCRNQSARASGDVVLIRRAARGPVQRGPRRTKRRAPASVRQSGAAQKARRGSLREREGPAFLLP